MVKRGGEREWRMNENERVLGTVEAMELPRLLRHENASDGWAIVAQSSHR